MTAVTRREILSALAAIAAVAATPGLAQAPQRFDLSAGRSIGEAYLAAHPTLGAAMLRRTHLPDGLNAQALVRLRARAAADFRQGRIFVHDGWMISETEAQLFAMLSSS